ncbi:MAG: N-acetylmuramoyl-L-alanine amidase-like domain-containing protein [Robiginitalea sp.]|uniref:N-acetylmuramoyl-L-alanine amidase-like domain-containing protein n=1 Tax=Robiginitalea sp. TaxID=1902411 RepID=UPI003C75FC56
MLKIGTLFFLLLCSVYGWAQREDVLFAPEDRIIFDRLIQGAEGVESVAIGEAIVATGQELINTPYVAGTLEAHTPEILIVNLRGLDCTTFVENVLVVGGMLWEGQTDWDTYLRQLERLRYRDGLLAGYPSRLHYFTDWIRNNAEKGLVKDITQSLGGVPHHKRIDFMGTHPDLYPALSSAAYLREVREVEEELSDEVSYVLAKEEVSKVENQIENGDIIALATSFEGLDVTHTGFAFRKENGRLHLLHASTRGSVEISKAPLAEYLQGVKGNTGIIVVRPLGINH